MTRVLIGLAASVATVVGVATGCSGDEPVSTEALPQLSVSLIQLRSDEPNHTLQVAVANDSDTEIHIADVQLLTDSFETLPPEPVDSHLGRTPRTDLKIPYGAARCLPDRIPDVQPASVVAHVSVGDGEPQEVIYDLPHPDPLLTKLLTAECQAYIVAQTAELSFGDTWTPAGDAMRGSLLLTRRGGDDPVRVDTLGDTSHFTMDSLTGTDPVAVLEAGVGAVEIPVAIGPSRCDAHAFAEAKKAFLFPITLAVGADEPRRIVYIPPKPVQETLLDFAQAFCGL